ncbi:hypothetical protein L9F63_003585, partial [Diploptera punctata]
KSVRVSIVKNTSNMFSSDRGTNAMLSRPLVGLPPRSFRSAVMKGSCAESAVEVFTRHCHPVDDKHHRHEEKHRHEDKHHEEKHHHHSGRHLQDLLRNLGRKVRGSLDATVGGGESRSKSPRRTSCFLEVPNDPMFRSRSRSLDDGTRLRVPPSDCEATYRIYDEIVKEGALLRRSSLDPDRRRLSLGTTTTHHRASDVSLDPHHAAILFRDSRGSKAN